MRCRAQADTSGRMVNETDKMSAREASESNEEKEGNTKCDALCNLRWYLSVTRSRVRPVDTVSLL